MRFSFLGSAGVCPFLIMKMHYPFAKSCKCAFESVRDAVSGELRNFPHAFTQIFKMFCQYLWWGEQVLLV